METTMTPESGNGLTINEAASQMFGMLGDDEAPEEGQVEASQEDNEAEDSIGDDVEDNEAEEADSDEEDENDEDSPDEPTYRIKMAGEEREITQSELIKLAQQGADYTKKSQQVAEERKRIEAEAKVIEEARKERMEYAERLQALQQYLEQNAPKGDDLEYLKENDPIGYAVKVAELSQQKEQMAAIRAEQERLAMMQQAEMTQQQKAFISQQAQLVSQLIPDYANAEKGDSLRKELRAYAKSIGYTDEEVNSVYDARTVKALYDAMQYARLQKSKPDVAKKVSQAPKAMKSGTSTSKQYSNSEQAKRDRNQLKQSGKVKDAARIFERFI
jgi:hypothetical protein